MTYADSMSCAACMSRLLESGSVPRIPRPAESARPPACASILRRRNVANSLDDCRWRSSQGGLWGLAPVGTSVCPRQEHMRACSEHAPTSRPGGCGVLPRMEGLGLAASHRSKVCKRPRRALLSHTLQGAGSAMLPDARRRARPSADSRGGLAWRTPWAAARHDVAGAALRSRVADSRSMSQRHVGAARLPANIWGGS